MMPIELFSNWYKKELDLTKVGIPNACCLSTNGLDVSQMPDLFHLKKLLIRILLLQVPLHQKKELK